MPSPARALAALALVAALATGCSRGAVPTCVARGAETLSGVVAKQGADEAASFASWRGAPVTVVNDYLGSGSWRSIANPDFVVQKWRGTAYHLVLSMPILPTDEPASLQDGAAGAYDDYFRQAAQVLVDGGLGGATIRPGWEMTGDWFAWSSLKDPTSYAAYFRRIVTAMRSVPGARFTFDWSISDQGKDPRLAYPGDAYVDYIGGDFYDQSFSKGFLPSDHAAFWNHIRTMSYGLDWLARFADEHHKRLTIPEWGLGWRCDGHGGGDDPHFVDSLTSWMADHDVAYEMYFEGRDDNCRLFELRSGHFPAASAAYQALATRTCGDGTGTPAVVPAAQPAPAGTTATAGPEPGTVRVSSSADRADSRPLAGTELRGLVYVFDDPPQGTRTVEFRLDGRIVSVEDDQPWDLNGTGVGTARPFDASQLAAGTHLLEVAERLWNGTSTEQRVPFTVAH